MTQCYQTSLNFSSVKRRKVQANFDGGDITSNAGVLLLKQADKATGLIRAAAKAMVDKRRKASCEYRLEELLRQRIFALNLGYEDLNDHQDLRFDLALQTAVSRDKPLSSPSTLSRFETCADRETAIALHEVLFQQFVAAHKTPPKRLVLDFDATDTPLHGEQEGRFFHGYYDHYCYLPLYVFCGRHLLVSYLRRSNIDSAKHAWAILSLLVKALRAHWPKVKMVFRGDSGFCRWRMLSWCERHRVHYIVGIARNSRLEERAQFWADTAEELFSLMDKKQRLFASIAYAAKSWDKSRRVIVKAEHNRLGRNLRFVVTTMQETDRFLYDQVYCARGDMENRIKDQQLGLFAHRTSSHHWWNNQFRQLLSGLAYVLNESLRRLALKNTKLENASPHTVRLVLLKIAAVVLRNSRRVCFMMSSAYPHRDLFTTVVRRLNTS